MHRNAPLLTADNIRAAVEEVLLEWEIPLHKASAVLTDNGSNIVAAFQVHFCAFSEIEDECGDEDVETNKVQDESRQS